MFDHVGVRVSPDASGTGVGPAGAPRLWLYEGGRRDVGVHIAFPARDRGAVDRFHAAGFRAGGRDNGNPGPRPDYGATSYAAYLVDLDGNNVEAVCLE